MDEEKVTPSPETEPETWDDDEPLLPDEEPETETPSEPEPPKAEEQPQPEEPPKPEPQPEPEPDYKALYQGEKERQNADRYRTVYQEQLGLTGNEALARMIARNESGGKDYPLEEAPDATKAPSADFRDALKELQGVYPDATEMPESVMRDFMNGKPLKDAYAAYRSQRDADTIASLRRENAALKKNASNRAAAPVKGSTGAAPEQSDPFLQGFDAEW